ncbi:patched domain-containing protein 3-like [Centruroides sculpturatus]|uniref:patched domain-containing protein 3-like n=1 Tax=Centruroides sculpturatus TaxID=218467 RepID=UPI000C6CC302|nr:patched domain-containing protein 3-like [Centruroides sculpturatus]
MNVNIVQQCISSGFRQLGRLIARRPFFFIITPLIVTGILSPGLYFLQRESDINYLFASETGRVYTDKQIIKSLFSSDESHFDWTRSLDSTPFAIILVISKDQRSLLEKSHFEKILEIDNIIQNLTANWNNKTWRYRDLCTINNGECFKQTLLQYSHQILNNGKRFKYPLEVNSTNYNIKFTALNFGGVQLNERNEIISVKAIKLIYLLKHSEASDIWQKQFLRETESIQYDGLATTRIASISIPEELERNAKTVQSFCSLAVFLMITFGMIVCTDRDWVKANPWLGLIGCISAGLGVLSAFGAVLFCGVKFNDIVSSVPYLMLGIGLDDTFVLLAAWKRTNPKDSVEDRMAASFSEAAVSITITSATNFISFLIGLTMPFPIIRIFCTYAATSVIFSYIYQVSFFGGFMALNGKREKLNLHSLSFQPVLPKPLSGEKSFLYRLLCTGGNDDVFSENSQLKEDYNLSIFLRDYLGEFLSKPLVKGCVVIVFLVYFALALVGCWNIEEGLERYLVFPYDSYVIPFLKQRQSYFGKYGDRIQIVIKEPIDYSDIKIQNKIELLFQRLENSSYFGDSTLTQSWLRYYLNFSRSSQLSRLMRNFDLENKQEFIDGLQNVFLKFRYAKYFQKDIIFNKNSTEILASRFIIQTMNTYSSKSEKEMLLYLYKTVDESRLPIAMYSRYLPLVEQHILVRGICLQTVSIAAVVMMIIFLIFIPNLICAACVAFSIISIQIGVLGYMTFWSVRLDTISMMNLIMCVGFSVDYASHISYIFQITKSRDPNEKLKWSLYAVGGPIIYGCLSTILGVFILSFTPSYMFVVFFKIVFLVILFAFLHGLLLIPIFLSIFNCCQKEEDKQKNGINREQTIRIKLSEDEQEKNQDSDVESDEDEQCSQISAEHSENK